MAYDPDNTIYSSGRNRARSLWARLDNRERGELGDALALGDFDWRDWIDEPPLPGFFTELDNLRINWEI
jgi:hypothetical protein